MIDLPGSLNKKTGSSKPQSNARWRHSYGLGMGGKGWKERAGRAQQGVWPWTYSQGGARPQVTLSL